MAPCSPQNRRHGLTNLYSFTASSTNSSGVFTTATSSSAGRIGFIGQHPVWDGLCWRQFASWHGIQVNTDGTGFTNLYNFTLYQRRSFSDWPVGLSGNTLCGTANLGGSSGNGTVFAVNTDGSGFTNLHSFHNHSH